MTDRDTGSVWLGLIGDNIAASRAPWLHQTAGALIDTPVIYDRLVPRNLGAPFEEVFEHARIKGFRGLNITYPYKERVVPLVTIPDAAVARLGAVNTVVFGPSGPEGYNTDWSGFIAAYRNTLGTRDAGVVCLVGAGGAGKAVGFGLLELGMTALRLVDRDIAKAEALGASLKAAAPHLDIWITDNVAQGCAEADGLVNCTPVGMVGYEGTPIPRDLMRGASWAFDAVYTPPDTQFLQNAAAAGLDVISGEQLFFYQGLHALSYFHGRDIDETVLRQALDAESS